MQQFNVYWHLMKRKKRNTSFGATLFPESLFNASLQPGRRKTLGMRFAFGDVDKKMTHHWNTTIITLEYLPSTVTCMFCKGRVTYREMESGNHNNLRLGLVCLTKVKFVSFW